MEDEYFTKCSCPCPPYEKCYHIAAVHDRDMLKLPIQGYVLSEENLKWIFPAEF